MILMLLVLAAGLIIGILRGGGLSGLAGMNLRAAWLLVISVAAMIALSLLPRFVAAPYGYIVPALQILRYAPMILFALLNFKNWRICIAAVGVLANFAVIAANGWQMPIGWAANSMPALANQLKQVTDGLQPGYIVMTQARSANLWFLADLFPAGIGFASVGDILLGLGVLLTVQEGMAHYSLGKHIRKTGGDASRRERTATGRAGHTRHARKTHLSEEQFSAQAPIVNTFTKPATPPTPPPAVVPEILDSARPAAPAWQIHKLPAEPEPKHSRAHERVPESYSAPEAPRLPQPDRKTEPAEMAQPVSSAIQQTQGKTVYVAEPETPAAPKPAEASKPAAAAPDLVDMESVGDGALVKLSPRLELVAFMVGRADTVADVGCDHGKLAAWLALNRSTKVIATDISSKSLAKTKQLIKDMSLYGLVHPRVSDGLKKLKPGEADVIVVAGLGGSTICSILAQGRAVASTAVKLVLQPMSGVGDVRRWLAENGYSITGEQLAEEDGRIYQILSAEPGSDICPPMSVFDLEVGHLLIEGRHPLLPKLLEYKISTIDKILSEIADNVTPKAEARKSELLALRSRCSEALEWTAR